MINPVRSRYSSSLRYASSLDAVARGAAAAAAAACLSLNLGVRVEAVVCSAADFRAASSFAPRDLISFADSASWLVSVFCEAASRSSSSVLVASSDFCWAASVELFVCARFASESSFLSDAISSAASVVCQLRRGLWSVTERKRAYPLPFRPMPVSACQNLCRRRFGLGPAAPRT